MFFHLKLKNQMANKQIWRAPWHDYRTRCVYMVTVSKRAGVPSFGRLGGSHLIPVGQPGAAVVMLSAVGTAVCKAIRAIPAIDPAIRLLQYSVMPDHAHILLFVTRPTAEPLGHTIARMKARANHESGLQSVFEEGFNDQIILPPRPLDTLFTYIRCNPQRLAVRRANPDFFRRVNRLTPAGTPCQAYGNMQLLENPWKEAVAIHRADTAPKKAHDRARWLYTAANGGVLVSPFISQAEKEIRREAESVDGKIILLTNEAFPERYKPAAHDFERCEQGRLLIIAPLETLPATRDTFLRLNAFAGRI